MMDINDELEVLFGFIRGAVKSSPDKEITVNSNLFTEKVSDDGHVVQHKHTGWIEMTFRFFDKDLV